MLTCEDTQAFHRDDSTKSGGEERIPQFCPQCGNVVAEGAKFCNQCGKPLAHHQEHAIQST
ncbi:zinc-ribbon domain-containing protein [Bifidobacterium boum]|uniref:zinc-ribbon domain-containing protein n=1 Tax=Bifidobacterium boum TaxID=78343 RepID=UPI003C6C05D6